MIRDPHTRAVDAALADYKLAHRPTTAKTHALLVAVMELVSERSGLVVTMRIGDGLITRNGEAR